MRFVVLATILCLAAGGKRSVTGSLTLTGHELHSPHAQQCMGNQTCHYTAPNGTKIQGWCCLNHRCIDPRLTCNGINDCAPCVQITCSHLPLLGGDNSDEGICASKSDAIGFIAAMIAAVFFGTPTDHTCSHDTDKLINQGSNFIPIKKYETGDG